MTNNRELETVLMMMDTQQNNQDQTFIFRGHTVRVLGKAVRIEEPFVSLWYDAYNGAELWEFLNKYCF